MQTNIADAKRHIAQMKIQLRVLEQQKSNSEGDVKNKQQEIERLWEKLADYQASVPTLRQTRLKTWRTVTIGQHKSLAQYRKAIEASKYGMDGLGDQLTEKIQISRSEKTLKLGKMTMKELGFKRAYLRVLFDSIRKLGGQPCPAEVALALVIDPSFDIKHVKFFMKGHIFDNCGPWLFYIDSGVIHSHGEACYYFEPKPYQNLSAYYVNKNIRVSETVIFMIPDRVKS